MTTFHPDYTPEHPLADGLSALAECFPQRFSSGGRRVVFSQAANGLAVVSRTPEEVEVAYARPSDAFRALGLLLAGEENVREESPFSTVGVMLDLSRNAVIRPAVYPALFARLALMGVNCVFLYMEDTYQLPEEPFFGYGRGAYSPDELRQIDECAARFGIEVIPCIQTLGHLEQILQWPAYRPIAETTSVLRVDNAATEVLIGKMLDTLAGCFRSRRIHIGMDEAWGLGSSRALRECDPFALFSAHLAKVGAMCRERGLEPMIWSDMYFRLGSATGDYYDREASIPAGIKIPENVSLVYWDYYHTDPAFYREWIRRHRALGKEPLFAAGAWTWGRLWTHLPRAMSTIAAGMEAARSEGVKEVFLTLWGDDGTECEPGSMLAAVQFFAEQAYTGTACDGRLQRLFAATCGGDFEGVVLGSRIDRVFPGNDPDDYANYGKWILWHDPVTAFLQIPEHLPAHYEQLASALEARNAEFAALLARALALKSQIHLETKRRYREKNRPALEHLLNDTLPRCIGAVEALWQRHRTLWHEWYKPFGWEVLEYRYAGVLARLHHLQTLLKRHLQNPAEPVEAFEAETTAPGPAYLRYGRASSPSVCR